MKYLKKVNEWLGQEIITGWKSKEEKFKAKSEIISQIDNCIEKFKQNPEAYVKYDETTLRENLIRQAEDDNFKGKVIAQSSPTGPKKHIFYRSDRKNYGYSTL